MDEARRIASNIAKLSRLKSLTTSGFDWLKNGQTRTRVRAQFEELGPTEVHRRVGASGTASNARLVSPLTQRQARRDDRSDVDLRIDYDGLNWAIAVRRRQPVKSIIHPLHIQDYCPFAFTAQPGLFDFKRPMVCILALTPSIPPG